MPNPYTGTDNDPFQQAQHNYLGPAWAAYFKALQGKRLAPQGKGIGASLGLLPSPRDAYDDPRIDAENFGLNLAQDARRMGPANAPLQRVEAELAGMREQADIKRALAIANDPNTSAHGRQIAAVSPMGVGPSGRPVSESGTYTTLRPNPNEAQPPVNRQAIAAQMAPGLIAPPPDAQPRPVTFGKPEPVLVDGKRVLAQQGSDGQLYDMARRPIGGGDVAPASDSNEPLETVIGPDGKAIRVRRSDAVGKAPAAGTEKASSGVQKRVLNFFNRAQQADGELEDMEAKIQSMGLLEQGKLKFAPNVLQSQTGQSYDAAQRAFTEARLRKDSGAAIPEQEFKNDRKTYFAQPGDTQETLEQKRRARGSLLASLAFESGQALGEFVGDADEAKAITQRYKDRAAGKKADEGGGMVTLQAPDGSTRQVPAAQADHYIGLGAKVVK